MACIRKATDYAQYRQWMDDANAELIRHGRPELDPWSWGVLYQQGFEPEDAARFHMAVRTSGKGGEG